MNNEKEVTLHKSQKKNIHETQHPTLRHISGITAILH